MPSATVDVSLERLLAHQRQHPDKSVLEPGWFGDEWVRLYNLWIAARWDAGDPWVRSVWKTRPTTE